MNCCQVGESVRDDVEIQCYVSFLFFVSRGVTRGTYVKLQGVDELNGANTIVKVGRALCMCCALIRRRAADASLFPFALVPRARMNANF